MSFASQSICAARAFGNSPQAENRKENRQSCERTLKPQYLGHPENWPIVLMVYRAGGANTTHTGTQNTCARKQWTMRLLIQLVNNRMGAEGYATRGNLPPGGRKRKTKSPERWKRTRKWEPRYYRHVPNIWKTEDEFKKAERGEHIRRLWRVREEQKRVRAILIPKHNWGRIQEILKEGIDHG